MALLIVILGCTAAGDSAGDDSAAGHSIRILEPADGATVCATAFPLRLEVTGVTLVDPYDPPDPLPEGAAHVDVSCNGVDCIMLDSADGEITGLESGFEY